MGAQLSTTVCISCWYRGVRIRLHDANLLYRRANQWVLAIDRIQVPVIVQCPRVAGRLAGALHHDRLPDRPGGELDELPRRRLACRIAG